MIKVVAEVNNTIFMAHCVVLYNVVWCQVGIEYGVYEESEIVNLRPHEIPHLVPEPGRGCFRQLVLLKIFAFGIFLEFLLDR